MVDADSKIGKFFAGFFHISKIRKTALQLNKKETLKPGKENAHFILFTHGICNSRNRWKKLSKVRAG